MWIDQAWWWTKKPSVRGKTSQRWSRGMMIFDVEEEKAKATSLEWRGARRLRWRYKKEKVERVCEESSWQARRRWTTIWKREDVRLHSYFTAKLSWFRAEEIEVVFVLSTIAIAQCVACCERCRARAMSGMMAMSSIGVFRAVACCPRWRSVCERGREMSPIAVDLVLGMSIEWLKQAAGEWMRLRCGRWMSSPMSDDINTRVWIMWWEWWWRRGRGETMHG